MKDPKGIQDGGGRVKKFINCSIVRNHKIVKDYLWVRNGKIINPEPLFFDEKVGPAEIIDCQGALIAPGFIDLQLNGGFGADFSMDIEDKDTAFHCITKVAKGILAHGRCFRNPTLIFRNLKMSFVLQV